MKFLCLAYGSGKDWEKLTRDEQDALLARDEVLRRRGDLVAAAGLDVATVRAWDGVPVVTQGPFAEMKLPLAGFAVVEASDIDEAIRLVADTPCARARGAIEIRPITAMNAVHLAQA